MDINIAIDYLGLNRNTYRLTQSVPPHSIIEWGGPDPQPTEDELSQAYNSALVNMQLNKLRQERNFLLSETDWVSSKYYDLGQPVPEEWVAYRQALRDLPANTEDPANPVWPTKPS